MQAVFLVPQLLGDSQVPPEKHSGVTWATDCSDGAVTAVVQEPLGHGPAGWGHLQASCALVCDNALWNLRITT